MAENEMARLSPSMPLAQASVNVVNLGVVPGSAQFVRADPVTYHPLGYRQPWQKPNPPPVPPTEDEIRGRLAQAIERQQAADAAVERAVEAHKRAQAHHEKAQRQAAEFNRLDGEISNSTIEALREGSDPNTVRERFADKLTERASVMAELHAAQTAMMTLASEMGSTSARAAQAAREVDAGVCAVLSFSADEIARQWREAQARMDQCRAALLGFDRLVTPSHAPMSQAVRIALGTVDAYATSRADMGPWLAASQRLRNDPQAEATVELPELKMRPLPQQIVYGPPVPYTEVSEAGPPPPPDNGDPHLPEPEAAQ
jgi:hypothetical protein